MFEAQLTTKMNAVSTDDMILAGNINDAIQANKHLRRIGSDQIEISVNNGVVTIGGHIRTATNKTNVESAVRSVPGIIQFENQLVADDRLTMTVAQALGDDKRMGGEQIGITAQHGFIYLTGKIGSAANRLLAAQIVASVPAVRGIVNRIQAPGVVLDHAEEELIQPAIGQTVYTTKEELGDVCQVIVQPASRRVSAVVVGAHGTNHSASSTLRSGEQHRQKRQIIIQIGDLRLASSGALFLKLHHNEHVAFADFDASSFVDPTVDWQPPYPYRIDDVLFARY